MADLAPHVLVVAEPEPGVREYELEHPDGCPIEHDEGLGGELVAYRVCSEDLLWADGGEYVVEGIADLAPGRYPLRIVVERTPSTPNGPAESSAWFEVVR